MQKIPLQLAASGMIVGRDVFRKDNPASMPICGRGTELTDKLIIRLDHLDIKSIYVEGHPVWLEGDKTLEEMLSDLDVRFSKTRDNRYNMKLLEIYRKYLQDSMGDDGGRQEE